MRFDDDLQFLHSVAHACQTFKNGADGMWQVSPVFAAIRNHEETLPRLLAFDTALAKAVPELGRYGRARAKKAYYSLADTITKPSYSKRLRVSNTSISPKGQLDNIEDIYRREPCSGGLVFSIFDPVDLKVRPRPGYVPCLVAGSFLVCGRELAINAFFRSQSVIEFGLHDLIFLRELQSEMTERFNYRNESSMLSCGALNLSFGRVIIQRRLARRRQLSQHGQFEHIHLSRAQVLRKWLRTIAAFTVEYECNRDKEFMMIANSA